MYRRTRESTRTDTIFPYTTIVRSLADWGSRLGSADLEQAIADGARATQDWASAMTRYDAVLSPVVRDPPPPLGLLAPTRPFDELSPAMFGYLGRSEEHTSELQSLMRTSYAVFCLKKKTRQPI